MDELAAVPIRRNTILLAGSMACLSGMFQLVAAVSSLTFVKVTGVHGLLGLGPAIFLVTAALAAYQAGRGMDRFGRIPPLAVGFVVATCGLIVTGIGTRLVLAPLTIGGFVLLGAALGTLTLVRTAGGDMYPPEQRAAGIALVLSGAVVGAILGPLVFDPLLSGRQLSTGSLSLAWFAAIAFPLVGLALVLCVRPDPRRVAELLAARGRDVRVEPTAAPIREIVRRPGVAPALLGALASFSVMASVMNLIGYVVVAHGNHEPSDVFPIIGAHVFGMYAFVVIVGPFVDRFGRRRPLVGGLVLMGACCAGLALVSGVVATAVLLFGLGLGWSFAFLAASPTSSTARARASAAACSGCPTCSRASRRPPSRSSAASYSIGWASRRLLSGPRCSCCALLRGSQRGDRRRRVRRSWSRRPSRWWVRALRTELLDGVAGSGRRASARRRLASYSTLKRSSSTRVRFVPDRHPPADLAPEVELRLGLHLEHPPPAEALVPAERFEHHRRQDVDEVLVRDLEPPVDRRTRRGRRCAASRTRDRAPGSPEASETHARCSACAMRARGGAMPTSACGCTRRARRDRCAG